MQDMDPLYDALEPLTKLHALHVINKALPYKTVIKSRDKQYKQHFELLQGSDELINTVLQASRGMTELHTLELVDQFSVATISR